MDNNYDIIIVGGGMAGAGLACSMINQGVRIALIEAVSIKEDNQPSYDDRGLALSLSSQHILEKLGVWSQLSVNTSPIKQIHVSDRGHFGFVRLHAKDLNIDALGHVVIAREMGNGLMRMIDRAGNIDFICPAEVEDIKVGYDEVCVNLAGKARKKSFSARLLVVADGTYSRIRQLLGISTLTKDYRQTAIVTNVTPERPHEYTAYERFTESGPIALLPLNENRCVLVYTVQTSEAETCLQMETDKFLDHLYMRFGRRLGRFGRAGVLNSYPLKLIESREQVLNRVVLLGNSAHTIHPNGAQGFNLCLRDAASLSEHLINAIHDNCDIGDKKLLDGYFSSRRQDQKRVMQFSDKLAILFYNSQFSKIFMRNAGMLITDLVPSLKREFIRQAMGVSGRQPAMVRGLLD